MNSFAHVADRIQKRREQLLATFLSDCQADSGYREGDSERQNVVFQSRVLWAVAHTCPEQVPHALEAVLAFVDPSSGHCRWWRDTTGEVIHVYGMSFALYALAAASRITPTALEPAQKVFQCLESNFREGACLWRESLAIESSAMEQLGRDAIGTPPGFRSQNSALHLIEAYTELLYVCPNPALKAILAADVQAFVEKFSYAPKGRFEGFLAQYLDESGRADWSLGQISCGHDIECAHLVLTAARESGIEPFVLDWATKLVDFGRSYAQLEDGSMVSAISMHDKTVSDRSLLWWVQAEQLLAYATLADTTGRADLWSEVIRVWDWIETNQIESDSGYWFENARSKSGVRVHAWKELYHESRAMLQTEKLLRSKGAE